MNKDLIISANRHETRVAILEDEQLVELYFQRANEYSLVGSIHKGRVTRVLPGMQSAFVDIGLERDAFLYVSDFFEDSEEYEPMSGGEGAKPSRGRSQKSAATAAPTGERDQKREESEPRERRGRRSRRRRSRGRGFPESKYAAEVASPEPEAKREEPEPPPPAKPEPKSEPEREPEAISGDDEFLLLPGESLAKYEASEEDAATAVEEAPDEPEPGAVEEAESDDEEPEPEEAGEKQPKEVSGDEDKDEAPDPEPESDIEEVIIEQIGEPEEEPGSAAPDGEDEEDDEEKEPADKTETRGRRGPGSSRGRRGAGLFRRHGGGNASAVRRSASRRRGVTERGNCREGPRSRSPLPAPGLSPRRPAAWPQQPVR